MSELVVGSIAGLAANSYVVDVASGSTLDLSNGAVFPSGSVIQVVENIYSTYASTSSTSYVTTGQSLSITPSSASSKILVMWSGMLDSQSQTPYITIYRDGSNLATGADSAFGTVNDISGRQLVSISFSRLDSPATTSSVTYEVFFRAEGASTVGVQNSAIPASLILMEIAG